MLKDAKTLSIVLAAVMLSVLLSVPPVLAGSNLLFESFSSNGELSVKSMVPYRSWDGRSAPMYILATFKSHDRQRITSTIQDKRVETIFPSGSWLYVERRSGFIHTIEIPGRGKWIIRTDQFFDPLHYSDAAKLQAATAALMENSGGVIEAAQAHVREVSNKMSKRMKGHIPPAVECAGGVVMWVASWWTVAGCATGVGCVAAVAAVTYTSVTMADSCAEAIEVLQNPTPPPRPTPGTGGSGDSPGDDEDSIDNDHEFPPDDYYGTSGGGWGCRETTMECGPYHWVRTGPRAEDGYWTQDCHVVCR